jgi:hypothetical protein
MFVFCCCCYTKSCNGLRHSSPSSNGLRSSLGSKAIVAAITIWHDSLDISGLSLCRFVFLANHHIYIYIYIFVYTYWAFHFGGQLCGLISNIGTIAFCCQKAAPYGPTMRPSAGLYSVTTRIQYGLVWT